MTDATAEAAKDDDSCCSVGGLLVELGMYVQRCKDCGNELSACGEMTADGPRLDCRPCKLAAELAVSKADLSQLREQVNAKYWEQIRADNANMNGLRRRDESELSTLRTLAKAVWERCKEQPGLAKQLLSPNIRDALREHLE